MSVNTAKVNSFFDHATVRLGVNRAGCLHRSLVKEPITPAVRAEVRKIISARNRSGR